MKIYIETYGCAANQADSDQMRSLLTYAGYKIVEKLENADLIILNSCGVKGATENKIIARLEKIKKLNKKVLIAGCLTKIRKNYLQEKFPEFSMIGPDQVMEVINVVKKIENDKKVIDLREKRAICCPVPFEKVKEAQPIVIQKGCLYNCTYCATKFARGKLFSFPIECIKNLVENSIKKGAKRILLTGQDTGAYGMDIGTNLVELLKELIRIKGSYTIRIGMMNPNHALRLLDGLVKLYKNKKIEKFIHIPVQAGSNKVLEDMKRPYKVEDFEKLVKIFRKEIPGIRIWTDIIVGYPTETDEDFEKTIELVKKIKPDFINISKFYSRPGTKASKLKQLPSKTIKKRSRILSEIFTKMRKLK